MGFHKIDGRNLLDQAIGQDAESELYAREFHEQYELIKRLVFLRKKAGLTQKDISRKTGLTQQMVSRIEQVNGTGNEKQYSPTLENFLKYTNAIGVTLTVKK